MAKSPRGVGRVVRWFDFVRLVRVLFFDILNFDFDLMDLSIHFGPGRMVNLLSVFFFCRVRVDVFVYMYVFNTSMTRLINYFCKNVLKYMKILFMNG